MNTPSSEIERTPEITRRLLGSSAIVSTNPEWRDIRVDLDIGGLIYRLLLFDTYVLYSVRLKEISAMVHEFGLSGTLELLSSGALELLCECAQFVEGQFNTPPAPPLTFQFHIVEAHIRDQYLIDSLSEVNRTPGLTASERMALQGAVVKAVRQHDNMMMFRSDASPAFETDILRNIPLIKAAIRFVLAKWKNIPNVEDFELTFHKVDDFRFETETTLPNKLSLRLEEVHNVIKSALLGISSIDQRISEMKVNSAISGFTEEELPLFREKLDTLAGALSSHNQEKRLRRVISLSGLPSFESSKVDIIKLLEIRNTPEAREFRGWLSDIDRFSDREISDAIASLNAKLGLKAQSALGKIVRLLVTSGVGFAPHLAIPALGLSALDQFAWDKFFRRSGIAAFVHDLYPSIFKPSDR